jgi:hypothetical protein
MAKIRDIYKCNMVGTPECKCGTFSIAKAQLQPGDQPKCPICGGPATKISN